MSDSTWIDERIAATKALIVKYEEGLLALAGGAQTYTLDTGQTRVVKQRADMGSMRATLSELENRLAYYEARKCGRTVHVIPGY